MTHEPDKKSEVQGKLPDDDVPVFSQENDESKYQIESIAIFRFC